MAPSTGGSLPHFRESLNCISLIPSVRRTELTGVCHLSALLMHPGRAHWFAGVHDHRSEPLQAAQIPDSGLSGRLRQRWGVGLQAGTLELTCSSPFS
ncbi:cDNA sequence AB041803 [Mus musculus]|uniref:Brain cDNA, clone MNCb-1768 n=1 Tax=Mus musculus TaxID=10090 RepID=Q8K5E3_MOUSE|nr:cDNA sequence AB041803 [Mus musculus]BAB93549.1 unnamed protein product [Mus musculus]